MNENQRWYYAVEDQTHGPVDALEIEHLIQRGVICPSGWIAAEGTEDWLPAKDSVFANKLVLPPQEEIRPATPVTDDGIFPVSASHDQSAGPHTPRVTSQQFIGLPIGLRPIFRRRWLVFVPGLFILSSVIILLHHFRHWHSVRYDESSSAVVSNSEATPAPVKSPTASTPGRPLDPDALKKQYKALTSNNEKAKAISEWEKEIAIHPALPKKDANAQWITFRNYLSHFNSLLLPSELEVVQQLGRKEYEARFYNPFEPGETFVLLTTVNNFAGPGRGSLPIRHIGTRIMRRRDGFERTASVFSEVTQDEPEDAMTALRNAALELSTSIRNFPPDDTVLERFISDINQVQADRLVDRDGLPHQEASNLEDDVLYVCLQTRLRRDIQPINYSEAASAAVQPRTSANPTPISRRPRSDSRVEGTPRPSASLSPSVSLATPGNVGDTRPSPSPRLAKPGTYFLLQYASVKTDRGVYGFEPGHEVHVVRPLPDKGTLVVSDGKCELEVASTQLTNDLDVATQLTRADAATQAQIVSRLQTEKSAAEAKQHALDVTHSRDVEAAERARIQNSRLGTAPNPLDQ